MKSSRLWKVIQKRLIQMFFFWYKCQKYQEKSSQTLIVHFRGELQHVGDVSQQEIKCRPIRTREIGGATLLDVLYVGKSILV